VGTVWVAVEGPGEHSVERHLLSGSRAEVREASVSAALALVRRLVEEHDV
jgi:nicotinamide mononucleotide (NMN) deamidase PncC